MKVIQVGENIDRIITLIPRITPILGDVLTISLRNELNNDTYTPDFTWEFVNSYLTITLSDLDTFYLAGNRFELNLFNGTEPIYVGKIFVLGFAESIQDYPQIEAEVNIANKKLKY